MAVLPILKYPDPILKDEARPVGQWDDALQSIISSLIDTMNDNKGCVGIAAPQIGELVRVVVAEARPRKQEKTHGLIVLVNPEITKWEGYAVGREGCLSLPDYTGNVIRAERIVVKGWDQHEKDVSYNCEGFESRLLQHEIDHLDGKLFIDRVVSLKTDIFRRKKY